MLQSDKRRELACAIGFKDLNAIKNYEMGRLPRLQILLRLAGALEVTIERMLVTVRKMKNYWRKKVSMDASAPLSGAFHVIEDG